jgi:glutaminyl-tRNA synthetase
VLDPLKLVITNYPADGREDCAAPVHPHKPELGTRAIEFGRDLWIERDDFMEAPPADYFRLAPGAMVRLRYAFVIRCTGVEKDASGRPVTVYAEYLPQTRSGTEGANSVKVKGAIHWLSAAAAARAEVRLFERLFNDPQPDSGADFRTLINPASRRTVQACIEPSLARAQPDDRFQFERLGYFVADRVDHAAARPVFNRIATLKDSWGR